MDLTLSPRRVLRALLAIIAVLAAANLCVLIAEHAFGHGRLLGFSRLLHFNQEGNLPSYFSALQLAFAAFLLFTIAAARRSARDPFRVHWAALACVLTYLSIDEAAGLHEMLVLPMQQTFHLTGVWTFGWYVPYGVLLGVFVAGFWSFFWSLPGGLRMRFAIAGAVFVAGAVGFEMLMAYLWSDPHALPAQRSLRAALACAIEEPAEMIGIALFVHALIGYCASGRVVSRIVCDADPVARPVEQPA